MAKDPAKEAEKAAKKAEKEAKKQAKKAAKEAKKEMALNEDDDDEGGGKVVIALVSIIIIVVWLAILCLLVKFDVGGFGSGVLYPVLKDVPYVNMILPEVKQDESGDAEYGYATLSDAIEQIKVLELQITALQQSNTEKDTNISNLNEEITRLRNYEASYADFEKIREEFYEEVVFGEESPDIDEYQKYYESIDADHAAELYKQVVKQTSYSNEVKEYARTYAAMKPASAAKIFESMTDNLTLVAEILGAMGSDNRASILGAMDADVAASLTELMAP